jgi:hypothetical protein
LPDELISGLTTQGRPTSATRRPQLVERGGIAIAGRAQAKLAGGEIADRFAVHREIRRPRGRHDLNPLLLVIVESLGADRLDLRHDNVRLMLCDDGVERLAIEHVDHLAPVGHLLRGGVVVTIDGDDPMAEAFDGDHELLPQLPAAQQHDCFRHLL